MTSRARRRFFLDRILTVLSQSLTLPGPEPFRPAGPYDLPVLQAALASETVHRMDTPMYHRTPLCGRTENAVKRHVWVAVYVYVLVAIVRRRLQMEASRHPVLQIPSLTFFEMTPFDELLQQDSGALETLRKQRSV